MVFDRKLQIVLIVIPGVSNIHVIWSYTCPLNLLSWLRTTHVMIIRVEKVSWVYFLLLHTLLISLFHHLNILNRTLLI